MIKNPTFGSDAEVFIRTLTDEVFPSCGLVGGTKDKPRSLGEGYFIQEDNVLVEFNIPPVKTSKAFASAFLTALRKVKNELPPSVRIANFCSVSMNAAYIRHIVQAQVFGCDPDYNAWNMTQNDKPQAEDPLLRTAAAHVHIGWDEPIAEDQINLIKMADIFVSIPSIKESSDRVRRQLYGKAGCFRPKDYGVEHRVLDNYWIFDPVYATAVFNRYEKAIKAVNAKLQIDEEDVSKIQQAINTYDYNLGWELYKKYNTKLAVAPQGE